MTAFANPNLGRAAFDRDALPAIDHRARVEAVQALVGTGGSGSDAFLFLDLVDVRWLTGFSGSNGWAVVTADDLIVGTDGRYGDRAAAETSGTGATVIAEASRVRLHERLVSALAPCRSVGLDPTSTTQSAWTTLAVDLALDPVGSVVKSRREIKDEAEIARMSCSRGRRRCGTRRRRAHAVRHSRLAGDRSGHP